MREQQILTPPRTSPVSPTVLEQKRNLKPTINRYLDTSVHYCKTVGCSEVSSIHIFGYSLAVTKSHWSNFDIALPGCQTMNYPSTDIINTSDANTYCYSADAC